MNADRNPKPVRRASNEMWVLSVDFIFASVVRSASFFDSNAFYYECSINYCLERT